MQRIFGFDIGTTSIGFAVIDHDPAGEAGRIQRLGVRIFPEARDPKGTPLNQERRQKRMVRRQLRRRRARRKLLNETLSAAGLLPRFASDDWPVVMAEDPYELRRRGLSEPLTPHQLGRALYHLSQRRHFKGRELEEREEADTRADKADAAEAEEKATKSEALSTHRLLQQEQLTLGAHLAARKLHEQRRRNVRALRIDVQEEFDRLWAAQAPNHPKLRDPAFRDAVEDAIFAQRPVFWRKNTLGECRLLPGAELCPKGSWLSQQRRMLEKLNNLEFASGNLRPLDAEERAAILARLQTQQSMTWAGVRNALRTLYKARGEGGAERSLRFNLEVGGDPKLPGNAIEAKLAAIFGAGWADHPRKQAIRDAVHQRLWQADYGSIGDQRVVILGADERRRRRAEAARSFIADFGISEAEATQLRDLSLSPGWEPFSIRALQALLPELEKGVRFGALINGPDWARWRDRTFPNRARPTGEVLDRLPSPQCREEARRIAELRNPTVVRVQNELRKVVNNLIAAYGKPDLIRIEVARDVGRSKRDREEMQANIGKNERRRRAAVKDLEDNGIHEPSRATVDRWLLWEESGRRCPYTGDPIGFDALFREGAFEVEHIWPRSISFDDSFANKTLCRRDVNLAKGNRTPFQYLGHDPERWDDVRRRVTGMTATKGGVGMSRGKVKRFLAEVLPEDFTARQLNDTGYAAREAAAMLKRLWPDVGPNAPVTVQAVTGRVTAQLRRLWSLNNILADDGEKTRADHRHHAVDALTVACTHPGITNRLSRYWQMADDPLVTAPHLPPPWPTIRADAEKAVADIVVSHRVRKKLSGPLHKETTYGDTGEDVTTASGTYRWFVTRKKVEALSKGEVAAIRDPRVRRIVEDWVAERGGDPKKAFPPYPRLGSDGPEIRKVRLLNKQQLTLMAPVGTGYADPGANHHIAIYRRPDGKAEFEVVSLYEAARRHARREPVVRRTRDDGAAFVMSLSPGDTVELRTGKEQGQWVVQGISAAGRPTLSGINDARPTSAPEAQRKGVDGVRKDFEPRFGGFMGRSPIKLAVDPIGRIRPAND